MQVFNALMARAIPWVPRALVRKISRRYIAGDTLAEALQRVRALNAQGFDVTLDVLGESASDLNRARTTAEACLSVLAAVHQHGVRATLSVKPTALGLLIDPQRCEQMLDTLLDAAATWGNSVCPTWKTYAARNWSWTSSPACERAMRMSTSPCRPT